MHGAIKLCHVLLYQWFQLHNGFFVLWIEAIDLFCIYLLSIAIISFVQKGLLSILTNTCYGNSRNLLSSAVFVPLLLLK